MVSYASASSSDGTTAGTWYTWVGDATATTASGTTWNRWVSADFSATTSTDNTATVWYAWSSGGPVIVRTQETRPETEAEKQARLEREAEWKRQEEERKRKEAEALQRAEDLLMMHLNAQQLKDWQREKFFDVFSQSGKRFRVKNFGSMNVQEFDEKGNVKAHHCIVPSGVRVPLPDQLIMQKLMLEHHEADFMRIANHRVN